VPFIYLSQGVSNETFQYALEPAEEAEVNSSGVQYGRATWKDGVAVFVKHGVTALDDWLHDEGVRNFDNVNEHLRAAQPWFFDQRRIALGKALTVNNSHAR
jgi:tagatose 1,6-diphosphate aldolase